MRAFLLALAVSLAFLGNSLYAIRRRRIREQAAILWLSVSLFMVLLSLSLPLHLLDRFSHLVGIAVPSNLVLLLAVLFLVVLVFHLSITVARLSSKTTALAQEIGILTATEPEGDGASDAGAGGPDTA